MSAGGGRSTEGADAGAAGQGTPAGSATATDGASAHWRPRDCHAHTTWSDGELTPAELVTRAAVLGVLPSITDHVSCAVATGPRTLGAFARYLDDIESVPVARGAEFCWHDALWRELPVSFLRRLTHRVGSIHAIHLPDGTLVHAFQPTLPSGLTPAAYMAAHIEELERFAASMPVDILAHPTLLPIPYRRLPLEELWTEEYEERAVEALHRAGIAFEVSVRYRPHERFVRRAVERGLRISLGSDGHGADQVANIFPSLELTRRLGVRDDELYDPYVHGARPV